MEQQVRFCTTSDGVRIAYATTGDGPPLVRVLGWATHLEFDAKFPEWDRTIWGLLARNHFFVRYDGRGFGLSDREVKSFSLEAKVHDLEAVADALKLRRFALLGTSEGGPTAVAYAARHRERVERLVLYGSFAWNPPPATREEQQLLIARLMAVIPGWGKDTPEFRQLWTAQFVPEATPEQIGWWNEMQRLSAAPETVAAFMGGLGSVDVRHLLADIKVPTLVVNRRGDLVCPFDRGRELAVLIPGARFLPLDGRNHIPMPGEPETEQLARAVEEFLAEERKPAKRRPRRAKGPSGLATILFTDVEGSTALTRRLGDARAREVLREHEGVVREALKAHGGSEVKTMGDGFMASFGSATRALECAIAIQKAFHEWNETVGVGLAPPEGAASSAPTEAIHIRVGLNAGEPIAEDEDLFGTAVNMAARIAAQAQAGEILASNVVRELVAGKGFLFADTGDVVLKGFEDAVRLYEVRWEA